MERTDRDTNTLNREQWNSLENNYDVHDIGQAHCRQHCEHMGFVVDDWGIDMRHEDDSLIYDDKMDLKLYEHDQGHAPVSQIDVDEADLDLLSLLEIKTKRSEDWFGVINRRHLRKYLRHAHEFSVPALIYMSLVDQKTEQDAAQPRIVRDTFIPLHEWDELSAVFNDEYEYYSSDDADQFLSEQVDKYPLVERTFRAPDGNQVVKLDVSEGFTWPQLTNYLYE